MDSDVCPAPSGQTPSHLSSGSAHVTSYPSGAKRQPQNKVANHYPHIDKILAGAAFDLLVDLTDMEEHDQLNKRAPEAGKHV